MSEAELVKHPAKYTDELFPELARGLQGCRRVLDCFGGTGKIGRLKEFGVKAEIWTIELEREWAEQGPANGVDHVIVGNALLQEFEPGFFDAVVCSPTYGNRLADHCDWKDDSKRIAYKAYLGRKLTRGNSGMWPFQSSEYLTFHRLMWQKVESWLAPGGLFRLNSKDSYAGQRLQMVSKWHADQILALGFDLAYLVPVPVRGHRQGSNHHLRVPQEDVFTFIRN